MRPKRVSKRIEPKFACSLIFICPMKIKIAVKIAAKMLVNQYIWASQCFECSQFCLRIVSSCEMKSPPFVFFLLWITSLKIYRDFDLGQNYRKVSSMCKKSYMSGRSRSSQKYLSARLILS